MIQCINIKKVLIQCININKQEKNNVIYELKYKNYALEPIDDLINQLQSIQNKNEMLKYAKKHNMQRIDEFKEGRKKLFKKNNDCHSEYKLLKTPQLQPSG